jgi:hypothetical protein
MPLLTELKIAIDRHSYKHCASDGAGKPAQTPMVRYRGIRQATFKQLSAKKTAELALLLSESASVNGSNMF